MGQPQELHAPTTDGVKIPRQPHWTSGPMPRPKPPQIRTGI